MKCPVPSKTKNKPKRYMFEQVVGEVLKGRLEPPIVVASAAVSKKTRQP
jgi:hypothetical protein